MSIPFLLRAHLPPLPCGEGPGVGTVGRVLFHKHFGYFLTCYADQDLTGSRILHLNTFDSEVANLSVGSEEVNAAGLEVVSHLVVVSDSTVFVDVHTALCESQSVVAVRKFKFLKVDHEVAVFVNSYDTVPDVHLFTGSVVDDSEVEVVG